MDFHETASDDEADAVSDAAFAAFGVLGRSSKGSLQIRKRRSAAGFASPPAESHSSPISTFDGTLFDDMSFQFLPSEDSVAMRLRSTSAVKGTFFKAVTTP